MTGSLLDVCLALLLIGAAAGTLVGAESEAAAAPDIGASSRASETAETLAGSTSAVEYTLVSAGGEAESDGATASPEAQRVAHATLAEHLARAAVRSATVDGSAPSPTAADYRRGVRRTVADAIGSNTRVRAVWRPLPCDDFDGTPRVEGAIGIGPHPPASTSVHAARFTVPVAPSSDSSDSEHTNTEAAGGVAARTIAVLFPPDRIAAAERGDNAAERVVRDRYRRIGAVLGVDAVEALDRGGPREANRALAAALADRHAGTDSPEPSGEPDACGSGDPGRVTVVVRTWSA
ncbi:hypothetical protein GRX01_09395 [Halobaculum sp. WSA2]|uniref:Uncharacterized protein n=1 Tax=Halobaculum saliterrae TaxID=2073113 RepID=A0A6B0SY92_9EURY|nr:hypothetical protein [Halobaculum saliterrae]MXR41551.1 hypothetical protein [Halobaculum saliterrae]